MKAVRISALLVTCLLTIGLSASEQSIAPCTAEEKLPLKSESNPTTRDAVVIHSDAGPGGRMVTAEVCLITDTKQTIQPGPSPLYTPPPFGLYFDWNLGIIAEDGRLVDLNGTILRTGPIDTTTANPITQPLSLSWNLGEKQPKPSANRILTMVGVLPCQDDTSTCSPDNTREEWVVRLLGSHGPSEAASWRDGKDTGCVSPMYSGEEDPHLRQLTVIGAGNQYVIYACLVSRKYTSLQYASFKVSLEDKNNTLLTLYPDGNSRRNIGKLFQSEDNDLPTTVTFLAVQISSIAAAAVKPDHAAITLLYRGCPDKPGSESCAAPVTLPAVNQKFQWFQR